MSLRWPSTLNVHSQKRRCTLRPVRIAKSNPEVLLQQKNVNKVSCKTLKSWGIILRPTGKTFASNVLHNSTHSLLPTVHATFPTNSLGIFREAMVQGEVWSTRVPKDSRPSGKHTWEKHDRRRIKINRINEMEDDYFLFLWSFAVRTFAADPSCSARFPSWRLERWQTVWRYP